MCQLIAASVMGAMSPASAASEAIDAEALIKVWTGASEANEVSSPEKKPDDVFSLKNRIGVQSLMVMPSKFWRFE